MTHTFTFVINAGTRASCLLAYQLETICTDFPTESVPFQGQTIIVFHVQFRQIEEVPRPWTDVQAWYPVAHAFTVPGSGVQPL